jgi:hypothetical protein
MDPVWVRNLFKMRHDDGLLLIGAMCDRHFFAEGKSAAVVNMRRFGFASAALSAGEE